MDYFAASINESPVLALKAGAALANAGGKAIAFDADGKAVLAGTGSTAIGVALMTNDEAIPAGGSVDVQIKDIGLAKAGGVFSPGDKLTADANGGLVKASTGAYIATALEKAAAPGVLARVIVERGVLAAAGSGTATPPSGNS